MRLRHQGDTSQGRPDALRREELEPKRGIRRGEVEAARIELSPNSGVAKEQKTAISVVKIAMARDEGCDPGPPGGERSRR